MSAQKRPRQLDVAKLAGVSPATVSIILNNRLDSNVRISAETRARVLDAITQLGYVVDPVARTLAGGRNALIGVLASGPLFGHESPRLYAPLLRGIEEAAIESSYDLLLLPSHAGNDHGQFSHANLARLRMVNGAILLDGEDRDPGYLDELRRLLAEQYPLVCMGRHELPLDALSSVAADSVGATAQIVRELLMLGHRRIAYWTHSRATIAHRDCYSGYMMAHRQMGLIQAALPAHQVVSAQLTSDMIERALAEGVTAFLVEDGEMADGNGLVLPFMRGIEELGRRAPNDLSLAVLNASLATKLISDSISGFTLPGAEMGRRCVRLLLELLQTPPSQKHDLPEIRHELIACLPLAGRTIGAPPH